MVVQTPTGGVVRKAAFQSQAPFTLYTASNMWPVDAETGRVRLSTRPGTRKITTTAMAAASDVRLLKSMVAADASGTSRIFIGASGGILYTWDGVASGWTAVSSTLTLSTTAPLESAVFGNKLYIADNGTVTGDKGFVGERVAGGTDGVTTASPDEFDSATYADWVAAGVLASDTLWITSGDDTGEWAIGAVNVTELELDDTPTGDTGQAFHLVRASTSTFFAEGLPALGGVPDDWVLYILEGNNAGTYKITGINGYNLTISPTAGGNNIDNLSWAVVRSTKVYDALEGTLTRLEADADKGTVPHGCKHIAVWQDRLALGNDGVTPQVWYMSASGNPNDYNYGEEQAGAAVSGNTFRGGEIGEPVSSLISHNRECILIGGEDSLFVMRGDPMAGGYIERLSTEVGPSGGFAWTYIPGPDRLLMMTRDGLYMMPDGCGDSPTSVSREKLPDEFLELDDYEVFLQYDVRFRGVLIALFGSSNSYWWLDLEHFGFWPLDFNMSGSAELTFLGEYTPAADEDKSSVMLGLDDGHVAQFDNAYFTDANDNEFGWNCEYGPIKVSPSMYHRILIQQGQLAHQGDKLKITTRTGREAGPVALKTSGEYSEHVYQNLQNDHYSFSPRLSGHAAVFRIEKTLSGDTQRTSVEDIQLILADMGRLK